MIKDKSFYKQFFQICIILVMQNVVTLSVNLADNVMLGNFSEMALSGAAAVNQIQFVYHQLLCAFGDALVIFGSQFWGKGNTAQIKKIASIAMSFAVATMLVFFVLASFIPETLVKLFTDDALIIEQGVAYLSIVKYTYIFFCISIILLALLRSVEIVKIAFYLSVSTLIINCGINWVLIYGRFGFPVLGIQGAAIGTLVARIVELLILVFYIVYKQNVIHIKAKDFFCIDWKLCKKYILVASPIIFSGAMWGVNTAAQTAILGHLSSSAIAANSVASNLFLLVKTAAIGAASTTSIMIGKAIGAKKFDELKTYSRTFQIMFVGIGAVSSVILFLLINPVLSLYSLSAQSKEMAYNFLLILTATNFFMAYQMPTNVGIIRGAGDTKYLMFLDITFIYFLVLPLSFFMAFVVEASPIVVVICLNIDQMLKCVPAFIKVNYGKWVRVLTH